MAPAADDSDSNNNNNDSDSDKSSKKSKTLQTLTATVQALVVVLLTQLLFRALQEAYTIRLHAINDYGRIIHEFDPYVSDNLICFVTCEIRRLALWGNAFRF